MVEDNLLLFYVLCRQPKTKFSQLISFAIEENIWGPIYLATNDSIQEKDPQKAKFYWLQKNWHTNLTRKTFCSKVILIWRHREERETNNTSGRSQTFKLGLQGPLLNRGPTTELWLGSLKKKIPFLNLPHIRPHAVMKLSLRTAFLAAKSALAFNAWFFYYTRSTSKTRLHQMALSAWKATAQQSISNSAIQSSVKGMQKRRGRKKGHGRGKKGEKLL